MQPILSVADMRESDAATIAAGTPGEVLMGRAGEGIFRAAEWQAPVAVVCGKGNNAGDGFVLALLLHEAGISCDILLWEERFSPDAEIWFRRCREAGVPVRLWKEVSSLEGYRTVADCIFGTGFRGPAAGAAAEMIGLINRSGAFVVSADLNSGLNGDSGLGEPAVHSNLTVSIGSWKPGHFLNRATDLMDRKVNIDIGILPRGRIRRLLEKEDLSPLFPPRLHLSNKGTYGTVALIGGSLRYSGAIRLANLAAAAMRSGAGIVRIAAPRCLSGVLAPAILESTLFPLSDDGNGIAFRLEELEELLRGVRAASFGMGAGNTPEIQKILQFLLGHFSGSLILDADALNALAALGPDCLKDASGRVLLTPHPGEFARLTGKSVPEILEASLPLAEDFAGAHGVTLLLKGPTTIVTDGDETWLTDRGCPGMATAGSGDVLSGIAASLHGWLPAGSLTAATAAWLNGRAGELAQAKVGDISMIASDTAACLPEAFAELRGTSPAGDAE